ncbi:TraB/VirB10 family protein [Noviherbaspirillum sp. CPCC 100848]|uniref:TraB/VirB10 family protein n=1 Tax=Noviherbaspirillum album TaxID=3080276 RepID=A0ABU6JA26_9BURK|nr:TraB/VirB10 family protein [Noviherbaspirillum sp. CPCC 100848]MEC4720476.1 TraB/VirB10 family protein [Noviherbaspirillum sp. CPCC 100848]
MSVADLKKKWMGMSQPMRTLTFVVGLMTVLMTVGALVMGNDSGATSSKPSEANVTNLRLPVKRDNTTLEIAAANDVNAQEIKSVRRDLELERENNRKLLLKLEEKTNAGSTDSVSADLVKEVMALRSRIEDMEKKGTGPQPTLNEPLPTPSAAPLEDEKPVVKLRVTGGAKIVDEKKVQKQIAPPIAYLPPGAMFEAVLLNGMDAPTSSVAQKNPVPALMRVKSEAILPNNFTHNIKECFVLVSGFGVLSSERAQLRTETFSCIKENGQVIEGKVDGYVVGEDGRVAPRGRLVSKQGQMIAKSLVAGVLSGFGQALTPTTVPQLNLMPGSTQQTQSADLGSVAQTGVARGFSDASKAASQFFLEMAREMTPVVEIDAGRKLTVVLIKGIELK